MNVYIFGASGQDGRFLTSYYLEARHNLFLFSRNNLTFYPKGERTQISSQHQYCSLIQNVFKAYSPDLVYYFAATHYSSYGCHNKDDSEHSFSNISLPLFVIDLLRSIKSRPFFIYASSSLIFGDSSLTVQDEDAPRRPVCSYSRAKVNIEKALNVFLTKGELDSSTLILYNHESFLRKPTFFTMKVISSVYNYINHGSPFPILYNKDSEIDMGYAPEYCYIISKVASLRLFGTYIISSGTTIVVKDFVSRVFQFFGSDYEVVYKKAPPRCTARLCGDNSKLLTDVGLKPLVTGSKLVDTLCRDFILNLQPNL